MWTPHEPLHLDEGSFVQWKTRDIPSIFVWIIVSLTELVNMVMMATELVIIKYDTTFFSWHYDGLIL
jgi:hypothetical protein